MRDLYLDAYSGISGDMMLGALLDLGVPLSWLSRQLQTLNVSGWRLEQEQVSQYGITGARARVVLEASESTHRHLSDIRALLESAELEVPVRDNALGVFQRLAEAEAHVHGTSVDEVHFHEVGAVDAIVDIIGACLGLHYLGVQRFTCSPLPLGTGFVRSAHGRLPVPAPATLELLSACGAAVLPGKGEGEMVTPTGAALVAHFGSFPPQASLLRPERVGYGFGTRELPWPNALRAVLGTSPLCTGLETDRVVLLECNIDDMGAEIAPYVLERLLAKGALDAWTSAIGMKKGRPGLMLSTLVPGGMEEQFARTLLAETTTLGVRHSAWNRYKAGRESGTVQTQWGSVRMKLKLLDGEVVGAAPEYEDCARLAREAGVPLQQVYAAASIAFGKTHAA